MNHKQNMPNITLSMDKGNQELLRKIAKAERRSISKQVIVMMESYIKGRD